MKSLLPLFLFAAMLPSPARARLLETHGQIEARYGPPLEILSHYRDGSTERARFEFSAFVVEVHFRGGVSVREAYLQKQPFTEAQGLQLLLNNTNLSPWITANFGKSYTREDGTAEAGGVGDRIFWIQLIRPRNNILNGLQGF